MKTALITGILGQDGYYLSQLLTEKGYTVHGISRRIVGSERIKIHIADLSSPTDIASIIETVSQL